MKLLETGALEIAWTIAVAIVARRGAETQQAVWTQQERIFVQLAACKRLRRVQTWLTPRVPHVARRGAAARLPCRASPFTQKTGGLFPLVSTSEHRFDYAASKGASKNIRRIRAKVLPNTSLSLMSFY